MSSSRGRSQVKPRRPSTGRPRTTIKAPAPAKDRVRSHRGLDGRRQRLPLASRLVLALAVAALGGTVFLTAVGAIGPLVGSLGSTLDGAIGKLTATAQPSTAEVVATNSPIIAPPETPYTNQPSATLRIVIPTEVVGTTASVRVYVALDGLSLAPIAEVPVGSTTQVQVPVQLTKGTNNFSAEILRSGAISEASPIVAIVYDPDPPTITLSSPKNNATIDSTNVKMNGATEAGADLIARNAANGLTTTGQAGPDGKFTLVLPIVSGTNAIEIRATDLAGNGGTLTVTVTQGTGKMTASLSASTYQIRVSKPPGSLQVRVIVHDPDGAPLPGASATFTLQIPGLAPISTTLVTDASGRASFTTSLVGPMTTGNGQAVVLITHPDFGSASDRVGLTFVK
jgi:hypothetical protein